MKPFLKTDEYRIAIPTWNEIFSYMIAYDVYAIVFCIQIHNLYYINILNYVSLPIKANET